MTDADELLPCPFCGSPSTLKTTPGSYGYYPPVIHAGCDKCKFFLPGAATEEYDWDKRKHLNTSKKAKLTVVQRWNTRAAL